jgi:hypothetical protein
VTTQQWPDPSDAGLPDGKGLEVVGTVTTTRAGVQWFYPAGESPYLDNAIECVEVVRKTDAEAYAIARVAASHAEIARLTDDRNSWCEQASARTGDAVRFAAERDAALAREKALREALAEVLALPQLAPEFSALDCGIGTRLRIGIVLLNARAVLNPPPAVGDSAVKGGVEP